MQLPLTGSDFCSTSPDINPECCAEHDLDYRWGGPWGDWSERGRHVADIKLALCLMLDKEIPESVAQAYYRAVRSSLGRAAWERSRQSSLNPSGPDKGKISDTRDVGDDGI